MGGLAGWSSLRGSIDMLKQYELADTLRRNATFFTNGSYYPYICIAEGGYTYTGTEEEFLEFVQDKGAGTMHDFFLKLDELPFYNRLSAALWNDGKDIDKMIA